MTDTGGVKRYDIEARGYIVDRAGDWVTYADHEAEVERLREAGKIALDMAERAHHGIPRTGEDYYARRDFVRNALLPEAIRNVSGSAASVEPIKHGSARNLRAELEVIASDELGDVLASWGRLSVDQAERLRSYLRAEIAPDGMLSAEKAREAGHYLATERAEARRVIAAIERQLT